jgi:chloramphenicol-sensitive protein RarD
MSAGERAADTATRGVVLSASAYLLWGFLPLYYRELDHVPVLHVLAHRGLWALVFVALIVTVLGRWHLVWTAIRHRRSLAILTLTGVLIASNWGGFIYAVANGMVLDASLGYFINPLMSVALGVVLLGERLNTAQRIAIGLAALGVLNEIILLGDVPWIALFLASTFALYGYLRKTVNVESIDGLFVEMAVLAPLMVGYLLWAGGPLLGFGAVDLLTIALLLGTGPLTATPLLLFAAGARRVSLATVGILQFIAPSIMFVMAVLHFREPFALANALTFAGIWLGLAVFAWDALRGR